MYYIIHNINLKFYYYNYIYINAMCKCRIQPNVDEFVMSIAMSPHLLWDIVILMILAPSFFNDHTHIFLVCQLFWLHFGKFYTFKSYGWSSILNWNTSNCKVKDIKKYFKIAITIGQLQNWYCHQFFYSMLQMSLHMINIIQTLKSFSRGLLKEVSIL